MTPPPPHRQRNKQQKENKQNNKSTTKPSNVFLKDQQEKIHRNLTEHLITASTGTVTE